MSIDAMNLALEALELWEENLGGYKNHEWPIFMQNGMITIRLIPPVRKVGGGRRIALQAAERIELSHKHKTAKEMLCAAINQAQEPVAWVSPSWLNPETRTWENESFAPRPINGWIPLYTAPRQWQGLTDDEINQFLWIAFKEDGSGRIPNQKLVRYIERKLKEKNCG